MDVRPSPIAGTWYSGSTPELKADMDALFGDSGKETLPGEVIALIAPHAGHRYSGSVAARAYACILDRSFDLVAVISPIHRPYRSPVLTSGHDAYTTPLGIVPIDKEALARFDSCLEDERGLTTIKIREDQEHALEIQLPFLQHAHKAPFRLLPIMLSDTHLPRVEAVGHALSASLQGQNSLLIGSSDLSHFYPQEVAEQLDREMLSRIIALQPERVLSAEREGAGFACGRAAIAAVIIAAMDLGANRSKLVSYATSGDITGDYQSVVGYGSVALFRQT
ncbi:MAG: AmmeMemoRadiSam system protein B [Anaerolineales bacterium]|nr:AmmeMemoRadiSam system protein B [Anaerolineales bacterium]